MNNIFMSHPDGVLVYNIEDLEKTVEHDQTTQKTFIADEQIKIILHNDAFL